jgi:PIN domain nuclease of toxin-antitoxin system
MMLLLDSHAFLWAVTDDPMLRRETRESVRSPFNDVVVSAATIWELAIKRALGRLQAPRDLVGLIERTGFAGLPITLADAEAAAALPLHHADPFDRMLVAQARRVGAIVVTRDPVIALYGVETLAA